MNLGHSDLHDQIREIVLEILQKSPVSFENQSNIEQSDVLSKEDTELLNQLF
jgi:predicted oxidoreductase (fatty acid repression mutant protein)